jgi:hypothetical protein
MVTLKPRCLSRRPNEEAVIPFPRDETTPPVTKMNLTLFLGDILIVFVFKYRTSWYEFQFRMNKK